MKPEEILELMQLNGWSAARLAAEIEMSETAVAYWLLGKRNPTGAASVLMRIWLNEARARKRPKKEKAPA